ncbi:MAG: N-acetyltransferase family protein [Bifidobacterium pseudolongum]|nr:N-acetyltransferase family protein [Bifidobacterium pseudolongum]
MTDYSYHVATDADLSALTDIYNAAIIRGGSTADTEPVTTEQRKAWLDSFRAPYAVFVIDADAGGTAEPIGFAAISAFNPRPGYDGICSLAYYITPQWQGRGAGKYALGVLIDECRARTMRMACTVIFADNAASSGLMERFGFTRYGLLPQAAYDSKGTLHDVGFWAHTL